MSRAHDHSLCTEAMMAWAEQACAKKGARLTAQRRDILACVGESHAAIGAYDIIERMAARGPRPAPITVYRALDFLMAQGLIHKIESRNAYVACTHAHGADAAALMICTGCGNVSECDVSAVAKLLKEDAEEAGFTVSRMVIEMTGLCAACGEPR